MRACIMLERCCVLPCCPLRIERIQVDCPLGPRHYRGPATFQVCARRPLTSTNMPVVEWRTPRITVASLTRWSRRNCQLEATSTWGVCSIASTLLRLGQGFHWRQHCSCCSSHTCLKRRRKVGLPQRSLTPFAKPTNHKCTPLGSYWLAIPVVYPHNCIEAANTVGVMT